MDYTKQPIRILHVLTAMDRGGTESMLMNLYRFMDRDSIQFDFAVTATKICAYDEEILRLGGKIIHYPKYNGYNHFEYKRWWKDFFANNPEYRIVHGHIGSTASIYLSIAKKNGCYAIAHSHSVGELRSLHDFLYKIYSFSTRYIADYFFGCSEKAMISRYGKRINGNAEVSSILRNAVEVNKFRYSPESCKQIKNELCIEDYKLVIGTVGRFTEAKNTFFIVDILHDLKKRNVSFKFIWAGTGELKRQVEEYAIKQGLQDEIIFLGARNDIHRVIQSFNVFILPSRYEGLPMVGVETQAAGIPFLCSDRVASEVKMTECVKFLPIDSTQPWIEAILQEQEFRRISSAPDDVIKAGYDVAEESQWLKQFYQLRYKNIVGDAQ